VKKGYEPPVHDFTVTSYQLSVTSYQLPVTSDQLPVTSDQLSMDSGLLAGGVDITEDVLGFEGYTFWVVAYQLGEADVSCASRLNEIANYVGTKGCHFLGLTASLPAEIAEWNRRTQSFYPFCTMDEVTLKTIVRSNPGLVLLHNATIIGKWSRNDLPSEKTLNKLIK
jgi:hypothetical protein